jgi:hypothetical protein
MEEPIRDQRQPSEKPGSWWRRIRGECAGTGDCRAPRCAWDDSHTQMWDTSWGRAMRQRRAFGRGDQDEEAH